LQRLAANTAIFTILDSVLLRTLPVANPRQLVMLSDPDALGFALAGDASSPQELADDLAKHSRGSDPPVQLSPTICAQLTLNRNDSSKAIEILQAAGA
jgi:hypothetical protein